MKKIKDNSLSNLLIDKKVCVMGLGYVGLTLAVTLADVGFEVLGVEIRDDVLKLIRSGEPHFFEPGLKGRLESVINSNKLKFSKKIVKSFNADVYIITVGTPIDSSNNVNKKMINNVCREISDFIKNDNLIILRSTVEVGTTKKIKHYFKKKKKHIQISFCPERTIEGKAMIELRSLPQIVGAETLEVALRVSQFFSFITPTVVRVSSNETAELIKLVDNCQRDVHFGLSNEIAEISDKFGVSCHEVIKSGSLGYPRTDLPMPGPVGGPCLEKDSFILKNGLKKHNYFPSIIMSSRETNLQQPKKSVELLKTFSNKYFKSYPERITLAGLAFKGNPETDDLRGSMFKPILEEIRKKFKNSIITLYDKLVNINNLKKDLKISNYKFTNSLEESFEDSSLYIICNNHNEFSSMPVTVLTKKMKTPGLLFDYWNNFSNQKIHFPKGIKYIGLGEIGKNLKALN